MSRTWPTPAVGDIVWCRFPEASLLAGPPAPPPPTPPPPAPRPPLPDLRLGRPCNRSSLLDQTASTCAWPIGTSGRSGSVCSPGIFHHQIFSARRRFLLAGTNRAKTKFNLDKSSSCPADRYLRGGGRKKGRRVRGEEKEKKKGRKEGKGIVSVLKSERIHKVLRHKLTSAAMDPLLAGFASTMHFRAFSTRRRFLLATVQNNRIPAFTFLYLFLFPECFPTDRYFRHPSEARPADSRLDTLPHPFTMPPSSGPMCAASARQCDDQEAPIVSGLS